MTVQENTALLIIDVINKMDFEGAEQLMQQTLPILSPLTKLKQHCKRQNIPVIYVNDNFGLWQENVNQIIDECRGGLGDVLIEALHPEEDDYFIIKPKHSGFFGTQLDILLKHLDVSRLIITGLTTDMCILFTANDAYMWEYAIHVPADCTAAETAVAKDHALEILSSTLSLDCSSSSCLMNKEE